MIAATFRDLWAEPAPEAPPRSRFDSAIAVLMMALGLAVAGIYIVTIAAACIGESYIYFLLGSAVEVVLLGMIVKLAWRWPAAPPA